MLTYYNKQTEFIQLLARLTKKLITVSVQWKCRTSVSYKARSAFSVAFGSYCAFRGH